jgi:3-dehydroquinate dehydratase-2
VTRVLVLNGPNLATLGERETSVYGTRSLADIEALVRSRAAQLGIDVRFEQTNHEGTLVDILDEERGRSDGCIINPAGLSHTSISLADAIRAFAKPVIEVHLSNIHAREEYRRVSLSASASVAMITGLGSQGYVLALEGLAGILDGSST